MKTVILSGGSGNDSLIRGLKYYYPSMNCKVIVNAYDNGKSTGVCRAVTNTLGVSDIRKNHIELILQEIRRRLHDTLYAGRILGSQCRNRAHRIHVICEHCLDICLDAGASTGVTSCDC